MNQDMYAAYIGIDWADRKHDIYLYDCTTGEVEERVISSQPDAIAAWVEGLRKRYGHALLALCLEQKRGPLIYALCQYENLVLYPINPRTVSNYRKAFQPSRAKSDPIDVRILGEKVRLTNRLTSALKNYYPQVLEWFEDKDTQVFCEFIERYPTVRAAQAATKEELTQFFQQHRVIRRSAITRRIEQIASSGIPLTEDPGIVEPMQWLVQTLIGQLKPLLLRLGELAAKIKTCFTAMPDAVWFACPSWCWRAFGSSITQA